MSMRTHILRHMHVDLCEDTNIGITTTVDMYKGIDIHIYAHMFTSANAYTYACAYAFTYIYSCAYLGVYEGCAEA